MILSPEIQRSIADELLYDLGGKMDGSRRNILVPNCPFCGHDGFKYGIYVGNNVGKKRSCPMYFGVISVFPTFPPQI